MNARTELPLDDGPRLRVPPHSMEAEQSVLGALLIDNAAWDQVGDILRTEDFFRIEHRTIFEAMAGLINATKAADPITVHERLQGLGRAAEGCSLEYLSALSQSVPSARNIRRYAEIVRDRSALRALVAAADEAATLGFNGEGTAAERIEKVCATFDNLQRGQVLQKPREAGELVSKRIDHYSAQASGEAPLGSPTGIAQLDDALNGGLQDGRVYVLAARPSVGKTSLSMQIGLHRAKAGDGVLLLSQEMPAEECIDRTVCNLGGVDYGRLQKAQLSDSDWGGLTEAADALCRMRFWIDDQPGLTLADIRAKAVSLRRDGLRLLIIDYLQLCSGSNPGARSTRNSELEEICRGLKTLAKALRIPVILLSQLSRDVEKRQNPEPTLADLRDSGAIEQDADCVLFLWFVRAWSDRKFIGMSIAKNRQGRTGQRIALEFRGELQRWNDSDADISPQPKRQSSGSNFE